MEHRYITTGSFETFEKLISKSLVYVDKSGSAAKLGSECDMQRFEHTNAMKNGSIR